MEEKGTYSFVGFIKTPRRIYRLTQILQVMDRASNRLSLSIIFGCIIVASSLIMARIGPTIIKDISIGIPRSRRL